MVLPGTAALSAFAFYSFSKSSLCTYLGYHYYLQFIPFYFGKTRLGRLRDLAEREGITAFLDRSGAEVPRSEDQKISKLCGQAPSKQEFVFGMRTASSLYSRLLSDALVEADMGLPHTHEIYSA
jgi:hypothetical protein